MDQQPEDERVIIKLLAELDFPVTRWRPDHQQLGEQFISAAEPLAQGLIGSRTSNGHLGFVVNQILIRAVTDLVTAFHLTMHGYLNQAYNQMRMAYEACDILQLVGQDQSEATRWIESETPWVDFSPANVRTRLGEPRADEIYSHCAAWLVPASAVLI